MTCEPVRRTVVPPLDLLRSRPISRCDLLWSVIYAIEYRAASSALSIVYSSILYLNQEKEDEDTLDDVSSRAEDIRTAMDWNYNIENRVEKIGITNVKVIIEIMIEIWIIKNIGVVIEHVGIIEMEIESRITFIEVEIRVKVI